MKKKILQDLASESMVCGPAAPAPSRSLLEMQSLQPSGPTELESAFYPDPQAIPMRVTA